MSSYHISWAEGGPDLHQKGLRVIKCFGGEDPCLYSSNVEVGTAVGTPRHTREKLHLPEFLLSVRNNWPDNGDLSRSYNLGCYSQIQHFVLLPLSQRAVHLVARLEFILDPGKKACVRARTYSWD